jgi:hypothetical protein
MNSRLQNVHILCNMERRKETVEFVGNRMRKNVYCVQCGKGGSHLLGVIVL